MPVTAKRLKNGKYQVRDLKGGKVYAKGTTKEKAHKQRRMLNCLYKKKRVKK